MRPCGAIERNNDNSESQNPGKECEGNAGKVSEIKLNVISQEREA